MTVLVEIVCSVSQEEFAQAAVEAFCKATGGLLIGHCVIEEIHKVLRMVAPADGKREQPYDGP
jgi:hypothetical protein